MGHRASRSVRTEPRESGVGYWAIVPCHHGCPACEHGTSRPPTITSPVGALGPAEKPLPVDGVFVLEEFLQHVDDRCGPAWRHSLLGPPAVDFLDQLRLDPDVDICSFPFHARGIQWERGGDSTGFSDAADTRRVTPLRAEQS